MTARRTRTATARRPLVVGLGGTSRADSTTGRILRAALGAAGSEGVDTLAIGGGALDLPIYAPDGARGEAARHFVETLRRADGLIIVSPGYHGSMSGLIKNALDYAEDLREDPRPYFDGRAVGLIAAASGAQAAVLTLQALRAVIHALRGWPTPLGAAIATDGPVFDDESGALAPKVAAQLDIIGRQVARFARARPF